MVNRNEVRSARSENSSFNQRLGSTDIPTSKFHPDDVILSLANAHENRRARQVSEWEMLRSRSFRRAMI